MYMQLINKTAPGEGWFIIFIDDQNAHGNIISGEDKTLHNDVIHGKIMESESLAHQMKATI